MKAMLYVLAVFCLLIGSVLSVAATSNAMAGFMLMWAAGSCAIFGALAAVFPER